MCSWCRVVSCDHDAGNCKIVDDLKLFERKSDSAIRRTRAVKKVSSMDNIIGTKRLNRSDNLLKSIIKICFSLVDVVITEHLKVAKSEVGITKMEYFQKGFLVVTSYFNSF